MLTGNRVPLPPSANWRWTHGYVENVAAAVVLAATRSTVPSDIS
jgi:hypothetical protein